MAQKTKRFLLTGEICWIGYRSPRLPLRCLPRFLIPIFLTLPSSRAACHRGGIVGLNDALGAGLDFFVLAIKRKD